MAEMEGENAEDDTDKRMTERRQESNTKRGDGDMEMEVVVVVTNA